MKRDDPDANISYKLSIKLSSLDLSALVSFQLGNIPHSSLGNDPKCIISVKSNTNTCC